PERVARTNAKAISAPRRLNWRLTPGARQAAHGRAPVAFHGRCAPAELAAPGDAGARGHQRLALGPGVDRVVVRGFRASHHVPAPGKRRLLAFERPIGPAAHRIAAGENVIPFLGDGPADDGALAHAGRHVFDLGVQIIFVTHANPPRPARLY